MLKLIACLLMLIDHIGIVFFPEIIIFRVIGRLSFPIFAHQVAVSFDKTSNQKKYLKRLFVWGLISQIPFSLIFGDRLNVLFSFFIAAVILFAIKDKLTGLRAFLCISVGLIVAESLKVDYGFFGVSMVLIFYYFEHFKNHRALKYAVLSIFSILYGLANSFLIEIFGVLSAVFMDFAKLPEFKRNKFNKYFFYVFYPVHLLVLWTLHRL